MSFQVVRTATASRRCLLVETRGSYIDLGLDLLAKLASMELFLAHGALEQMKRPSLLATLVFAGAVMAPGQAMARDAGQPPAQSAPLPVKEDYAITPDGVRIYYRVVGSGREVVLAPFALYHRDSLDALARGRRVVTFDPRGRGRSAAVPAEKISLNHLLIDLDTVRRAVGAERIAIIGWSGGGMESFVYALRNPDRVTRLVQLAPVTARAQPYTEQMLADRQRRTDKAAAQALKARIDSGEFATDPAGRCRAQNAVDLPALLADRTKLAVLPDVCDSRNEQQPALGRYFGALWPSIGTFDWRSSLPRAQIPRLVIYPLQDNISRSGVEEWVRGQRNARIVYIDASGHFPQYEQPAATLAAINTFLDGQWPADARTLDPS